jgi:hypothetical protein
MSMKKNEIEEMDQVFENFLQFKEKEFTHIPNYKEIFLQADSIKQFNRRIIECNK